MAAAAEAADRLRVPFALDLEDFHSADQESPSGDLSNGLARRIERDVLPRAAFLTAGSPMIAEAYEETYGLRPTPIHNTFTIDFGGDRARHTSEPLRVYWFSQTIGAGRGLDDVVRAFGAARIPAELHLRGRPVPSYLDGLRALRREVAPLLTMTLHGPVPPDDLIRAAQSYDAGLSCEEPTVVNHRLCLGNKIFTYLAAGVPVILSRTPAQAALAADLGSAAFPYDSGDVEGLASVFGRLAQSDAVREQARDRARAAAKRRWHWEHPLDRGALVALVRTALS
jgi:glycosyltransferase involved in cell wall biosynthesis